MYLNSRSKKKRSIKLDCLTITWDVFESYHEIPVELDPKGLTITWDVFEFKIDSADMTPIQFNYNMGCI